MKLFVTDGPWPNAFDAAVTTAFLAGVLVLCAAGYVFMVLDFRAYLRSLKRSLLVIGRYLPFHEVPPWARAETPRAIAALGLRVPCTEADLMRAYRKRVKRVHPDHGGDEQRFLRLQADFEEALSLVRSAQSSDPTWQRAGC